MSKTIAPALSPEDTKTLDQQRRALMQAQWQNSQKQTTGHAKDGLSKIAAIAAAVGIFGLKKLTVLSAIAPHVPTYVLYGAAIGTPVLAAIGVTGYVLSKNRSLYREVNEEISNRKKWVAEGLVKPADFTFIEDAPTAKIARQIIDDLFAVHAPLALEKAKQDISAGKAKDYENFSAPIVGDDPIANQLLRLLYWKTLEKTHKAPDAAKALTPDDMAHFVNTSMARWESGHAHRRFIPLEPRVLNLAR